jgi:hypothetical protein
VYHQQVVFISPTSRSRCLSSSCSVGWIDFFMAVDEECLKKEGGSGGKTSFIGFFTMDLNCASVSSSS